MSQQFKDAFLHMMRTTAQNPTAAEKIVKLAKRNVSNAKARLTRAKNKHASLRVLMEHNREIDRAKAFASKVYLYQHTLEDHGIDTLDQAAAFLRSHGVAW